MKTRSGQYRYREVFRVCLPLVLGMSVTTIMEFTDRVFLSNYSLEAISAASPAGITAFLFVAFFGGISGYTGVFISQYFGRGNSLQIGRIFWQGLYFSLAAGLICWLVSQHFAASIFQFAGHDLAVREQEIIYFSILCKGAVLHISMHVLSAFFSGRGLTRPVLLISMVGVLLNIPLDYALIFGHWGFPRLGIAGAAIATVTGWGVNTLLLALLVFVPKSHSQFGIFSQKAFSPRLFFRLLRFGIPGSLQFTIDILAFTIFIMLVGRLGTMELAVTNIVLSVNSLAFMPSMGVSQGVSILVGQALGRKKPDEAKTMVWSAIHLLMLYIACIGLVFIFFPENILRPFLGSNLDTGQTGQILATGTSLLKIVTCYLCMDAFYMVFSGALKGAGDTRFLMIAVGICSPLVFLLPVYFGIVHWHISVTSAWLWVLIYVIALFLLSAWRYRLGKWQNMLVIEQESNLI